MEKKHKAKIIGAVVSGSIICLYYLFIIIMLFSNDYSGGKVAVLICGGIFLAFIFAIIFKIFERIKEIKGGEEDDLSKY